MRRKWVMMKWRVGSRGCGVGNAGWSGKRGLLGTRREGLRCVGSGMKWSVVCGMRKRSEAEMDERGRRRKVLLRCSFESGRIMVGAVVSG